MEIQIRTNNQSGRSLTTESDKAVEVTFSSLFRFAQKSDIILMILGTIFSLMMGTALPIFANITGSMIDSFGVNANRFEEARQNLLYFIYLGIGTLFMATAMYTTWSISGERQAIRCRKRYFSCLIRQEIGWFDTQKQAELASNFALDTLAFQQAIGQRISTLIMLAGMLITGIGISLYNGWILTLIILAYMPILIFCWAKNVNMRHQVFEQHGKVFDQSDNKAQQSLAAIKLVKQMNAQDFETQIQATILDQVKEKYSDTGKRFAFGAFISVTALYAGFTLTFWYGSECVFGSNKCPQSISWREYTAGSIVKIFYALFLPALSLNQLTPSIQKIVEGLAAAKRIYGIIDRQPRIKSKEHAFKPDKFEGIFTFVNVSFAYPKDKNTKILKNFNLTIDSRNSAFVGKSGCGKSTVFQLIMRFYDPDEGAVLLDGCDLRELDLDWLRSQIGYVGQEPVLFATSIRENLLLVRSDATDADINDALTKAEARDFIQQLPDKLETFVGSGGSQLSGGQKQRIAIARALLKHPRLLMLDEATSALDRANERQILNTLKKVEKEFITMSITHRKRVLRNCDTVYEFQHNKTVKVVRNNPQYQPNKQTILLTVEDKQNQKLTTDQYSQSGAVNKNTKKQDEIAQHLKNPSVQKLDKSSEDSNEPEEESKVIRLLPQLLKHKCLFTINIISSILAGLCFPFSGFLLGKILISLLKYPLNNSFYQDQAYKWVYTMLGLTAFGACAQTTAFLTGFLLGQRVISNLRTEVFDKMLRLPVPWFEKTQNQHQKVINKLTISCKTLHGFLSFQTPILVIIVINVLSGVIGSLAFQWRTGLTSLGFVPLLIFSQLIQFGFVQGFAQSKGKIYDSSSQIVNESIMNIRTVLSLGSLAAFEKRYFDKVDTIFDMITKKCLISGLMYGFSNLLQFLTFGLIFFLAAVFVDNSNVSIDDSLSAVFLVIFACISVGDKANLLQNLQHLKSSANWVFSLLDLKDEEQLLKEAGSQGLKLPIKGNIEFKDVSFKYENRQNYALNKINLTIKEGQEVALVGSSGCGKSTVISMLLGFYKPQTGHILIEGIDINDYDIHHLRSSFGVVSQEPILFNESIEWNIRYNLKNITSKEVYEAADAANFNPNAENFQKEAQLLVPNKSPVLSPLSPNTSIKVDNTSIDMILQKQSKSGFNKNVGPKGSHVSGGQKQRIAIARAILRQPTVLLLDQATSALDPENEHKVQQSLEKMMRYRTTIAITHRMEILDEYKRVYLIKDGKVEQEGMYGDLLQDKGQFFNMLRNTADRLRDSK